MFYAPVLAIVQSPHTELRRSRTTSTRHLLVPVVLADNMPPLQNPLYNIGWVEEFCPGIYHVTMFQLHPGSIYVSSFSIISWLAGPTRICSFTLPPLLHSPPLRCPPAMLWLQHDVGTWRVPKEVQPLKTLKKVKVQRASCLCRWAPFNVWTSNRYNQVLPQLARVTTYPHILDLSEFPQKSKIYGKSHPWHLRPSKLPRTWK